MTKDQLRKLYKEKRKEISSEQLEEDSISIANHVLSMNLWDKHFFHIYLPILAKKEINTEPILNILAGKDKNICLPRSDFNKNTMESILLTDSTILRQNTYGIVEPVEGIEILPDKIEVIFVPLLAYDKNGNRVGYGKGFYDRFLANCKHDSIKIGLSFFEPEDLIDDSNELDIKLDYCVTPNRILEFNPRSLKII